MDGPTRSTIKNLGKDISDELGILLIAWLLLVIKRVTSNHRAMKDIKLQTIHVGTKKASKGRVLRPSAR